MVQALDLLLRNTTMLRSICDCQFLLLGLQLYSPEFARAEDLL
jgi:hypothetical protein